MSNHTHRWRIAEPQGETSAGVCEGCGETRDDFRNAIPETDWLHGLTSYGGLRRKEYRARGRIEERVGWERFAS